MQTSLFIILFNAAAAWSNVAMKMNFNSPHHICTYTICVGNYNLTSQLLPPTYLFVRYTHLSCFKIDNNRVESYLWIINSYTCRDNNPHSYVFHV